MTSEAEILMQIKKDHPPNSFVTIGLPNDSTELVAGSFGPVIHEIDLTKGETK